MDEIDIYKKRDLRLEDVILFKYPEFKDMDDEAKDDFWMEMNDHDKYIVNQITTIANGFGRFHLYINEASRSPCRIENYKDLLTWDKDCWNLQRKWRIEDEYCSQDIGEYVFNKSMTGEWIRFIEKDRLVYGTLYSLSAFLWWKMEDLVYDIENEIVPHEFNWEIEDVEGCECEGYRKVNINVDANGREEEYEKIKKLTYSFIESGGIGYLLIFKMSDRFKGTFRVDTFENPDDPYSDLIICDQETLANIRPENFISDITRFQNESSILDDLIKDLIEKVSFEYREFIKANM